MPNVRIWLGCAVCALLVLNPMSAGPLNPGAAPRMQPGGSTRLGGPSQAVSAAMVDAAATPPPSVSAATSPAPARETPPLSLTLMLIFTGCSFGLVIAVMIVGFIAARGNRVEGKIESKKPGKNE